MDPKASDLTLEVVLDQSQYVRGSLRAFQLEGLLGAGFAALVVLVFLRRLRSTVIVLVSLPLAILAALLGLHYSGATLNAMTLGGLALVIGILIDQSIVVVEAIVRHIDEGREPFEAALSGTREVAAPVLISTVTLCVVFFPVTLLSGMASYLFSPVALAATLAMAASYVFAIPLVPAFSARILKARRGTATRACGWRAPTSAWSAGRCATAGSSWERRSLSLHSACCCSPGRAASCSREWTPASFRSTCDCLQVRGSRKRSGRWSASNST